MRLFKILRNQHNKLVIQAEKTIAVRAMVSHESGKKENVVVVTYKLRQPRTDGITGNIIDEIQIEMDVWEANELAGDMMNALDAAMPTRRRGSVRVPWGE